MSDTETETTETPAEERPLDIPTPTRETDEDAVTGPTTLPDEDTVGPGESEPIEGDDDEGDQAESEQEPESLADYAPGVAEARLMSERERQKRDDKIDRERERHKNRIEEILEDEAQYVIPCPVCLEGFDGWLFDPAHRPLDENMRNRMLQLLGLDSYEDMPEASWAQTCESCNGHGRVKTGSKVEGREVTQCMDCAGAGWRNLRSSQGANGLDHVEHEPTATGPTIYGLEPDPRIQSLAEEGYTVVPPIKLPTGV